MDQWAQMAERFHEWTSPLRPSPEDIAMFSSQLRPQEQVLLLGVTEELQSLASVAVDNNPKVVAKFSDRAILADWGALPFDATFDAAIGDGCLTVFQGTPDRFFQEIQKALGPNGRLVLRLFISPEKKEDLDEVLKKKKEMGFHAFKWRVAHALANPYVPVRELYRIIRPVWNHPTLEVYRDSDLVYYFPKLSELPPWNHIQFGKSYELADRCPVVTWQFTNSSNFPEGNSLR